MNTQQTKAEPMSVEEVQYELSREILKQPSHVQSIMRNVLKESRLAIGCRSADDDGYELLSQYFEKVAFHPRKELILPLYIKACELEIEYFQRKEC